MSEPTLWDQPVSDVPATATRDAAYRDVAQEEQAQARADPLGLGARQLDVFRLVRSNTDLTNMEIATMLSWSINRVTPRVKELREMGKVEKGRRRTCQVTGRVVQAWKATLLDHRYSVNPCVRAYGLGPLGVTCKTCTRLAARSRGATYYKCTVRGDTRSAATDHRVGWPACAKYEESK